MKRKSTTVRKEFQAKTNDPHARGYVRAKAGPIEVDPLDYPTYPYPSMRNFARLLGTRYDSIRTRHAYYRHLRLIQEHFQADPASLSEDQLRDYVIHIKNRKHWAAQTIRQAAAVSRLFFEEMLGIRDWKVFGQIRTRDSGRLPAVLSRAQIVQLLRGIHLRRYRTPIKLIYCAGLRLSECLSLTVHDIKPDHLIVRDGKGGKDRIVPLASQVYHELRQYWLFHRNRVLIFPNAGRGSGTHLAARMQAATRPMPVSSLQRLVVVARKQLGLPDASIHTLRHSSLRFAPVAFPGRTFEFPSIEDSLTRRCCHAFG
jgi:integrase